MLQMHSAIPTIAIDAGNTVLIRDGNTRTSTWAGGAARIRTLYTFTWGVDALAIGQDGRLIVVCRDARNYKTGYGCLDAL
jgi:hypothetical protein